MQAALLSFAFCISSWALFQPDWWHQTQCSAFCLLLSHPKTPTNQPATGNSTFRFLSEFLLSIYFALPDTATFPSPALVSMLKIANWEKILNTLLLPTTESVDGLQCKQPKVGRGARFFPSLHPTAHRPRDLGAHGPLFWEPTAHRFGSPLPTVLVARLGNQSWPNFLFLNTSRGQTGCRLYFTNCIREAILCQIKCFFTHCVNGPWPPPLVLPNHVGIFQKRISEPLKAQESSGKSPRTVRGL